MQTSPLIPVLALLVLLGSTARGVSKSYDGWRVLRVAPPSAELLELLERRVRALGPDAGELWRQGAAVDVLLRPEVLPVVQRFLDDNRIPSDVHVPDLGLEIRRERSVQLGRGAFTPQGIPDPLYAYLRHSEMNEYLNSTAEQHHEFVRVKTIGESFEGRPIKVIQISNGGGEQNPVILVDGGMHAREWITSAMVLHLIQRLLSHENQYLFDRVDWHIVPLVNPDGYEYSHKSDRMWRKTRSRTGNPSCLGVDGNRNFDIRWGLVGVSWDPCTDIYPGSKPFSEPEAAALAEYALSLRGRVKLYVSVHCYGGVLIYPWGYSYSKPQDTPQLEALANLTAKTMKSTGFPAFYTGNCFEAFGSLAAGGSDDWMKAVAGVNLSYTLEMPGNTFTTHPKLIKDVVVPTFEAFRVLGSVINKLFG